MIPLCDTQRQYHELKDEIDAAMLGVAESGQYILGPEVKAFEQEMAAYCGSDHAVGVGSGTDALHLALRALGIGPGDEVITTPFTFIATTEAIGIVGATPVFVDIDPGAFNLDPAKIEAAITPRTKALLPVHLYGQPCDMGPIEEIAQRHGLYIVEDCAQSLGAAHHGRKTGAIGTVGCLSFFPSKNLGCFGDGGMVVTSDPEVFERVEMLRRHGGRVKYQHTDLGLNSRLDALQAAVLRVKLRRLDAWNRQRAEAAGRYDQLLKGVAGITTPSVLDRGATAPIESVYHQYTIATERRDALAETLRAKEIGCAVYYPTPLHLQPVHAGMGHGTGSFPHAERAAQTCLSLPMFPGITAQQQQTVAAAVAEAMTDSPQLKRCA